MLVRRLNAKLSRSMTSLQGTMQVNNTKTYETIIDNFRPRKGQKTPLKSTTAMKLSSAKTSYGAHPPSVPRLKAPTPPTSRPHDQPNWPSYLSNYSIQVRNRPSQKLGALGRPPENTLSFFPPKNISKHPKTPLRKSKLNRW